MSTQHSADVYITNNTGGRATIHLFHENSDNGTQGGRWDADPGARVGPLHVLFRTGIGSAPTDYWSVLVNVLEGPNAGFYVNSGGTGDFPWYEYELDHDDDEKTLDFEVSTAAFDMGAALLEWRSSRWSGGW